MQIGGARRRRSRSERSLVWLLGSPRTGSTWLLHLLRLHPSVRTVDEPLIGAHLGTPAAANLAAGGAGPVKAGAWRALDVFGARDDYFFADRYRDSWAPPLRELLLSRLACALTAQGGRPGRNLLVVKEPNGSESADLLSELLPGSRLLVLLRDGRDVVDSLLDAVTTGGWATTLVEVGQLPAERLRFLEQASLVWVERMRLVQLALARHDPARQLVVRYEDLLDRTQPEVERTFAWLCLDVPRGLAAHVARLSFDQVGEKDKGSGRFQRAARPGLWRDNLSPAEQELVTVLMAPTLNALGYADDSGRV